MNYSEIGIMMKKAALYDEMVKRAGWWDQIMSKFNKKKKDPLNPEGFTSDMDPITDRLVQNAMYPYKKLGWQVGPKHISINRSPRANIRQGILKSLSDEMTSLRPLIRVGRRLPKTYCESSSYLEPVDDYVFLKYMDSIAKSRGFR